MPLVLLVAWLAGSGVVQAASETVLYSFAPTADGAAPSGRLAGLKGTLYGVTDGGGNSQSDGTVFSITPGGTETVMYSFAGGSDGFNPQSGLVAVGRKLYGTTFNGGQGGGTVFSITRGGKKTILYSFLAQAGDGGGPFSDLINVKGLLYGTNYFFGAHECGTVYSITPSGVEKVVHAFAGGSDGCRPTAGLIDVGGTLYGTTTVGGGTGCGGGGCGTVYSLTPDGAETVLYAFAGGNDGADPVADLVNVNGTLYGTTVEGGGLGSDQCSGDCGTVFSITSGGTERVLHSFAGSSSDGGEPYASLLDVSGTLYGTTAYGGDSTNCHLGCGTVFSITTGGSETVVHSFENFENGDGATPLAGLRKFQGTLYGMTSAGGTTGLGTVYIFTP